MRSNSPAGLLLAGSLSITLACAAPKADAPPVQAPVVAAREAPRWDAPVLGLREFTEPAPEFGGVTHVLEAGPLGAPVLVLIHGLGERAARDFDPLLPALSRRYRILTFDLPGFGRSTRVNEAYAPVRYARFIHGMITRRFREPVAVLGHSMGGALALLYASEHPERVARLLLLDVAGVLYYRAYLREVIVGSREASGLLTRAYRSAREVLFGIGALPASLAKLEDLALSENATLRSLFSSSTSAAMLFVQHDFGPALRGVRAPTWLGWGRHDTVAPQRTRAVLRYLLKPTRDELFEHSAHVPMQSDREPLLRSLQAFLDEPSAPEPHPVSDPAATLRAGSCVRQSDRVFEGDYDTIALSSCRRVLLRNVRARSLWMERSEVELSNVELTGATVGAVINRSQVRWTGGRVDAAVCFDADASALDIAGVDCVAESELLRVRGPSRVVASVSALEHAGLSRTLHGEYELSRTAEGDLPELVLPRAAFNGRTALTPGQWAGAALAGEDLRRAPLRGVSLEDADLQGANFEGAALVRTNLSEANLRGATLRRADLTDAQLDNAQLERADLRDANLRGASLEESDLSGADLRGAELSQAKLAGARLQGALYDARTTFPPDFVPASHGMVRREGAAP